MYLGPSNSQVLRPPNFFWASNAGVGSSIERPTTGNKKTSPGTREVIPLTPDHGLPEFPIPLDTSETYPDLNLVSAEGKRYKFLFG